MRRARFAAPLMAARLLSIMALAALLIGCAALPSANAPESAPTGMAPLMMPDPARLRRSAADLPPAQVGAFTRHALRGGRDDATAQYRSGAAVIEMTVRRYATAAAAAAALDAWRRATTPEAMTTAHAHGMTAWTDRAACGQAAETVVCATQLAPTDDAAPLQAFLAALTWREQ